MVIRGDLRVLTSPNCKEQLIMEQGAYWTQEMVSIGLASCFVPASFAFRVRLHLLCSNRAYRPFSYAPCSRWELEMANAEAAGTNEKTAKSTMNSIITMLSPARRRRAKHSSNPEPGPVYVEMEEPNGNMSNPELSSDRPADQIAELPAEVERPAVQAPGRASESSWTDVNSNAGTVETAGENAMSPVSPMSPNLDVGVDRRGRSVNRDEHVLSFMNYNDNTPSPVR